MGLHISIWALWPCVFRVVIARFFGRVIVCVGVLCMVTMPVIGAESGRGHVIAEAVSGCVLTRRAEKGGMEMAWEHIRCMPPALTPMGCGCKGTVLLDCVRRKKDGVGGCLVHMSMFRFCIACRPNSMSS